MKFIKPAVLLFLIFMLTAFTALAADEQGFFRYPDVSKDNIVFSSEGDLWIVSHDGGAARRLTTHDGDERYPKFSPNGKWIAYTAEYDGNNDVYLIPVDGGEPKRLTYHPYSDLVVGWTPGNKIIFRSRKDDGQFYSHIFTVDVEGNFPEMVELPKAALASFASDGNRIAYTTVFRNNATWKHYKGGLADQIWIADLKKKEYGYKPVSAYLGHNSYPMWIGERIYFLSDSVGRQNVWSMKPDGGDLKKHTDHKKFDARWASDGDGFIVYELAMEVWKLDLSSGKTSKVDIQLPSERLGARDKLIDPSGFINDFALNEDGSWMAIAARGQLFSVPTKSRSSLIRQMTNDFTARAKFPFWVENSVYAITDASGEDEFYSYDPFLKKETKQISKGNKMWRYHAMPSSDGKNIAYSDGNCDLFIMDAESGKAEKIAHSDVWEIRDYEWSPDSRYLAYVSPVNDAVSGINIYDTETKEDRNITDPMYNCYHPSWDPEGKYFYFLGETYVNPQSSRYYDQFVYLTPDKIYMYLLNDEVESPFATDSTLLGIAEDVEEDKDKDKEDKEDKEDKDGDGEEEKEEELKVDIKWEGLQDRLVELPISAGLYFDIQAAEGMVYYASRPSSGRTPDGPRPEASLKLYKLDSRKEHNVMDGIGRFQLSGDKKVVVVQSGNSFLRMDAGATEAPSGTGDDDPHVKLDGWSIKHYPRQEWQQMFNEAWRVQRDFFYDENMHGVDWKAVYKLYEPLVPRISTRADLNDLIGQMIGEMSAGHAYIFGGDWDRPKRVSVGMLGADISRDKSGFYRIDKILAPDRVHEEWRSPLAEPHVEVAEDDYIVAVNGTRTNSVNNYLELMQDKAGMDVILTVNSKPSMEDSRDVLVTAMGDEGELRYRDWVEGRHQYVIEKSGGKLGYVHMSDMGTPGLREFGRMYYPQYDKAGMILDVRNNGGGNIAMMLLSVLDRKVWATGTSRHGGVGWNPSVAFNGHYAIMCNNETGSDGETFTQGAKSLELGPVFGTRTWGGWVGIRSDKPLNDQAWFTSPEFSGWGVIGDMKGKWLIEGPGVYPDHEIENDPGSVLAGKDPQLDMTIKYLLDKIAKEPKKLPPRPPIPKKDVNTIN